MEGSEFRFGEADLNALIRLVFETSTRSRRVYKTQGNGGERKVLYLERNGRSPLLGACSVQDFRSWCIRRQARPRPATRTETQNDWNTIRAMPGKR